jgi:uncharacterized protein (DUF934 family)
MQEQEDWWSLVTETDTGQQFVEHKWSHMHRQGGKVNEGEKTLPLAVFLETETDPLIIAKLKTVLR